MNTPQAGLPGALVASSSTEESVPSLPLDATAETPVFETILSESTRPSVIVAKEVSSEAPAAVAPPIPAVSTGAMLPARLIRSLMDSSATTGEITLPETDPPTLGADSVKIEPLANALVAVRPAVLVPIELDWVGATAAGLNPPKTDDSAAPPVPRVHQKGSELTEAVVSELQAAGLIPVADVVAQAELVLARPEDVGEGEPAGEATRPVAAAGSGFPSAETVVAGRNQPTVTPVSPAADVPVDTEATKEVAGTVVSAPSPEPASPKADRASRSEPPATPQDREGKLPAPGATTEPVRKTVVESPPQGMPVREQKPSDGEPAPQREMRRHEAVGFKETTTDLSRTETAVAARLAANISNRYRMADAESVTRTTRNSGVLGNSGISAAKSGEAMKNKPRENQIAEPRLQNVPVGGRDGLTAATIAPGRGTAETSSDRAFRFANPAGEVVSMPMGPMSGVQDVRGSGETPALSSSPVKPVEQLLLNLTREVMQFKKVNAESMAVVLKPDGNTEIFLHLAMRNGAVEVQARFERGDFSSLNSQWSQLQQTMQQQGVKLGNLQESFQQQHQQQQQNQQDAGNAAWSQGQSQQQKPGRDALEESFVERLDEKLIFGSRKASATGPARNGATTAPARGSLEAWA